MKKIKGFTLIECLVALAILGVASLIMAQIYGNVARINRFNHDVNNSLAYQMKYVEDRAADNTHKIKVEAVSADSADADKPPHMVNSKTITKMSIFNKKTKVEYSYAVDYYVLMSMDQDGDTSEKYNSTTKKWEDNPDYNGTRDNHYLNYKYVVGHGH